MPMATAPHVEPSKVTGDYEFFSWGRQLPTTPAHHKVVERSRPHPVNLWRLHGDSKYVWIRLRQRLRHPSACF